MTARQAEAAYTITEAAELKSVSPGYIRKAIRSNGLPDENGIVTPPLETTKVGKSYRIDASALDAWWKSLPKG